MPCRLPDTYLPYYVILQRVYGTHITVSDVCFCTFPFIRFTFKITVVLLLVSAYCIEVVILVHLAAPSHCWRLHETKN